MKRINPVKYLDRNDKDLIASLNSLIDKINQFQSALYHTPAHDNVNINSSQISDAILNAEKLSSSTPYEHPHTCAMEIRVLINELKEIQVAVAKRKEEEAKKKERDLQHNSQSQSKYHWNYNFKEQEEYDRLLKDTYDLYYITHFDNLESIVEKGILSRNKLDREKILFNDIGNEGVLDQRKPKIINSCSLWEYANLYFEPRNAMLFDVMWKEEKAAEKAQVQYTPHIIIVKVSLNLNRKDLWISDGNAGNNKTDFRPSDKRGEFLPQIKEVIKTPYRSRDKCADNEEYEEQKRQHQSECLVFKEIIPDYIKSIQLNGHELEARANSLIANSGKPIAVKISYRHRDLL
tara:strand:- start:491 stop:1534 length:1044 start_codon:yes stop_codon:yes gene_type:complete